jgi:predicted transcriptional regulator
LLPVDFQWGVVSVKLTLKKCEKERWILYGYVLASTNKIKIIKLLGNQPMVPTQIEKTTGLSLSHISRLLGGLRQKGLVECINSEQKKGRLYVLTDIGFWIYKKLIKLKL